MSDNRTTELRGKLDELGIEHFDYDKGGRTQTQWEAPDGKRHFTYETSDNPAKTARLVIAWHPTPEQAIAATLGSEPVSRGTLTAEQVCEAIERNFGKVAVLDDGEPVEWRDDWVCKVGINYKAIADELNAELGGGNCVRCAEDMGRYADSLCDPLKERIAELLRCLENDWHIHASWDGLRKFWCIELTEEGVRMRDAMHGTLTAEQVREAVMSADRWEKPMGNTGLTNTHLIIRDDGWQAIADELNARAERTCEFKPFRGPISDTDEEGERQGICSVCSAYMHEQFCFCPNCGCKVVGA